jgi:hypothetical protein
LPQARQNRATEGSEAPQWMQNMGYDQNLKLKLILSVGLGGQ